MQNLLDSKMFIFVVSVVFLAGTGWMNIQASTTDLATIEARLDKMAEQSESKGAPRHDDLRTQVDTMQDRLVRLEQAVDKLKENQQQMAFNLGAVCAATGAKCQ